MKSWANYLGLDSFSFRTPDFSFLTHLIFSSAGLQALSKFLQCFCTGAMYKKWICSSLIYLTFPTPPGQVFLWNLVALSKLCSYQCLLKGFVDWEMQQFLSHWLQLLPATVLNCVLFSEELITLAKAFASLKCSLQVCYLDLSYFIEYLELEVCNKVNCLFWIFVSLLFNNFNFLHS